VPIAGQIARGSTSLVTPVSFRMGDADVQIRYAGLVPNFVGLYQFNIVVPGNAPNGDLPLRVTFGDETLAQTLYIPVKTP